MSDQTEVHPLLIREFINLLIQEVDNCVQRTFMGSLSDAYQARHRLEVLNEAQQHIALRRSAQ